MQAIELLDDVEKELPSYEWLQENFKSKAAASRYLYKEYNADIKSIASLLHIPYRQVFGTIRKMRKDAENIKDHTCPVCRRKL